MMSSGNPSPAARCSSPRGVADQPADQVAELLTLVRQFTAFTPDNDPHGKHDFGAIDLAGEAYFWKIDYYDLQHEFHSPDAADPAVIRRVLTIMQTREY
jgi:hypothetical protein